MDLLYGKRLVIFGCGYVGSALAHTAVAAGAHVTALTHNRSKAAALQASGIEQVVVADLATSDWHQEIKSGADFVVNCVSSGGGTTGYQRSYIDGLHSILQWAALGTTPVGTMLYTSSTSVYPQGGGMIVDESMPAEGATPNGRIIRESEKLLAGASMRSCQRWFILRLAGIYGPGRHHLLDQLRTGTDILGGSGEYHLNLIHRDDIVTAMGACLTAPPTVESTIFNVADQAPGRRGDVVRWLADKLRRPMPAFDGLAGARRGGEAMPDRLISSGKIQQTLGWRPLYPDYRAAFEEILAG